MSSIPGTLRCAALGVAMLLSTCAFADEGMWTLDNLPLKALKDRYGFSPPAGWVERVQKGCVNFGGGSGSFVSASGLVMTNHHVGRGQLQKLSTPEHNYARDGFFAHSAAEELKCPDLEISVLQSTEDVTSRVTRAIDPRATEETRAAQRRAVIATLEKESTTKTGLKSRVVELYHGGEYWLYRSKVYTDVRLVMAPEQQAAFHGGDYDNFSFPRHDLDFTFFRVYENGQAVRPAQWFRFRAAGPKEGELVFVAGHPGVTSRLKTVAQLETERDLVLPIRLELQRHRYDALKEFASKGPENARKAAAGILGLENNLKRQTAFLGVLQDPAFMDGKRRDEAALRERVEKNAATADAASAWDRVAAAQAEFKTHAREYLYRDLARGARLVNLAEQIVRYVAEMKKPNDQRLEEFRDSNLRSLKFQMFSPAPVYPDADAVTLETQLKDALAALGPDDSWVKAALGGRTPHQVAAELTGGTTLGDVAVRRKLVEGGQPAVEASRDPLIVWARRLDPLFRETYKWYQDRVVGIESLEGGRIARARFALDGHDSYPDATGSLRLSYGKVAGYEQLTTRVPWKTTFYGLYDRSESFEGKWPFNLSPKVAAARARVDLATPLDFVSTNDIIGGNSGSPVLDKNLEIVGLVFDGNVQGFVWNYRYEDEQARCVSVHPAAILEALRKIYGMDSLADELTHAATAAN